MYSMEQTMRWFGPHDPVSLAYIRQAGCAGVVTALHHFLPGEVWTVEEILKRKAMVEEAGMRWTVVESLPVSEDIKKRNGAYRQHIEAYKQSLRHLAGCGIKVVTYNFMPVLDWLRTDVSLEMPDGSRALYFERAAFIAFDLYMLKRPGAENDYTDNELRAATFRYDHMTDEEKERIFRNALLGLPGTTGQFTADEVLEAINSYAGITAETLHSHLISFLAEIAPVAESLGLQLAIHPDDPPFPVLGLPRIMSTEEDAAALLAAVPSPANGLCFCTGSFGAGKDNDLLRMLDRFSERIFFLHLRNTKRDDAGNFYEAAHLKGDADMVSIISEVLRIQKRRQCSIPMRPDHGHQMLDDLQKKTYPGYSAIGRLKGLAELRGLEFAIRRILAENEG